MIAWRPWILIIGMEEERIVWTILTYRSFIFNDSAQAKLAETAAAQTIGSTISSIPPEEERRRIERYFAISIPDQVYFEHLQ